MYSYALKYAVTVKNLIEDHFVEINVGAFSLLLPILHGYFDPTLFIFRQTGYGFPERFRK
jgi:hypothetical protein